MFVDPVIGDFRKKTLTYLFPGTFMKQIQEFVVSSPPEPSEHLGVLVGLPPVPRHSDLGWSRTVGLTGLGRTWGTISATVLQSRRSARSGPGGSPKDTRTHHRSGDPRDAR